MGKSQELKSTTLVITFAHTDEENRLVARTLYKKATCTSEKAKLSCNKIKLRETPKTRKVDYSIKEN